MSLPLPWVDKIFLKLTLIYGRDFIGRWEGLEIADVKTDWGHELSGFENWPEAIAHALANCPPGKPPTVIEFRDLARKAPRAKVAELPAPAANPERVAAELAKLAPLKATTNRSVDRLDWARRIIARHVACERITPTVLKMAKDALKGEPACAQS